MNGFIRTLRHKEVECRGTSIDRGCGFHIQISNKYIQKRLNDSFKHVLDVKY